MKTLQNEGKKVQYWLESSINVWNSAIHYSINKLVKYVSVSVPIKNFHTLPSNSVSLKKIKTGSHAN